MVDDTNRTTQGYAMADVGMTKVLATLTAIRQIDPTIQVETVEDRYRPRLETGEAVFCCVDSIEARAAIWRSAQRHCRFWCDGRMLGEVLRVQVFQAISVSVASSLVNVFSFVNNVLSYLSLERFFRRVTQ